MGARLLRAALAALLVITVVGSPQPATAKGKVITYTVQPGDSIWSIAEAFYGSGSKYKIIYKNNTFIGSPPYILKPGQVLTLPIGEVSPEAQVDWLRREGKAKPPRALDWLDASRKMNLWKLYKVSTGDESAVHIVFEDQSDLRLGDESLLVIYGSAKATAATKRREKTRVLLEKGTARGGLAALDAGSEPLEVETPSGFVELLSKQVQVQADAMSSAVSVYDGKATVTGGGHVVEVPKDFGTVVKKGKPPEPPRPLPPPPDWAITGSGGAVAVVPAGGTADFEAAWKPVRGAAAYRVELAEDEAFKRVPVNVLVDADVTRFALDNIPVGRYLARISARDHRRLEGRPSAALAIDVVGLRSSRRLERGPDGGWECVGFSRLDLGEVGDGLEWSLDDGPFMAGKLPTRVQRSGVHTVNVRRVGQTVVTPFELRVLGVRATLEVDAAAPLRAGTEETRQVTLIATDERGRPASLPGLVLEAAPGGPVPLEVSGPGRWIAHVPAPAPPGPERVALTASWPGGVLAGAGIDVIQKFPDVPYQYRWRTGLGGIPWSSRGLPTPLPGLAPIDRVSLQTAVARRDGRTFAGLTIAGELSLLDDDLALDAAWTLLEPTLNRDELRAAGVGDLVLGARYLVVRETAFTLAASVRGRVPLLERDGGRTGAVEPGLLARFRLGDGVWLGTRQAALLALGDDDTVSYAGDYAAIFRVSEGLDLTAQLDSLVALTEPADGQASAAFAAGVGAQLRLDRVRLGLTLGFGLGAAGQRRFGDLVGALSVDFGEGVPAPSEL